MLAQAQTDARSLDTRNKINLGGLVILSGLASEDAAVLLGVLALAARQLAGAQGEEARGRFRHAGDQAFKAREMEKLAENVKLEVL